MDGIKDYTDFVFRNPQVEGINNKIEELKEKKKDTIAKKREQYKRNMISSDRNRLMSDRGFDGIDGLEGTKKRRKKSSAGTQSAGQKRNIANLKKVQAIAKQLKAKNPKMKHTQAVKKAWEELQGKKSGFLGFLGL